MQNKSNNNQTWRLRYGLWSPNTWRESQFFLFISLITCPEINRLNLSSPVHATDCWSSSDHRMKWGHACTCKDVHRKCPILFTNNNCLSPENLQCTIEIISQEWGFRDSVLLNSVTQKVPWSESDRLSPAPGHALNCTLHDSRKSLAQPLHDFSRSHTCSFCLKSFHTFAQLLTFLQKINSILTRSWNLSLTPCTCHLCLTYESVHGRFSPGKSWGLL